MTASRYVRLSVHAVALRPATCFGLAVLFFSCSTCGASSGASRPYSKSTSGAPAIASQPDDQLVVAGQTATFAVTVSGSAPLSYQWKKNGTAISGATSPSYTTPVTTNADSGAQFTVTVSNSSGSVTSDQATLTIAPSATAPGITAQPLSQGVVVGQSATFSVVATGTSPLSYQWKKSGTDISGATSASYTTPATTLADDGTSYSVTVTNSVSSVASAPASLAVTDGKGLFLNGFFLIGTFMPNMTDFKVWHDRGANAGVGENYTDPATGLTNATSLQAWDKAAKTQGMRTIRRPMPNPSDDVGNTTLLAWAQMDEPDAAGAGLRNLATEVANYQQWKAADPNRPVYLNFAGPDVLTAIAGPKPSWCLDSTGGCSLISNHMDYINQALDWASEDIYPAAGNLPDESRRYDVSLVGDPIDKLRSWTDKPVFCYIETSNQKYTTKSTRGVTRDEVRAEIWVAIVHGVRGYVFFPQVVPPNGVGASNDGTPPDVAAELTIQNQTVTQLATVLQGDINPTTLGATVPAPLQAGWRDAPGGRYFFVVNTKQPTLTNTTITLTGVDGAASASVFGESRTVTLANGQLTDTFGAFAVHIYVVAK